jgi:hypothetical protein
MRYCTSSTPSNITVGISFFSLMNFGSILPQIVSERGFNHNMNGENGETSDSRAENDG